MTRAAVLTTMSRWLVGGGEDARIREAVAAMEDMETVEARYRENVAAKLSEAREMLAALASAQGKEAVARELQASIEALKDTQARLELARESRHRRLREARVALAAQSH